MASNPPPGDPVALPLLQGRHGEYALEGVHGRGGSSITYRAHRLADGLPVVVKVLRLSGMDGWNPLELFERESAVLRVLSHPNASWVDDFPLGAPGAPAGFALVQSFVEGRTLAEVMRIPGALSPAAMLDWFDGLLGILEYLHERAPPVIHRDVTPKNVILRPDGGVALVDFGSVQAAAHREGVMPTTSVGTFGYAAPEQFLGRATPATDLHGAAMTFLAVASGQQPSEMQLDGARVNVRLVIKNDPRLARLLESMTETNPRQRLAEAGAARRALAQLRRAPPATTALAARDEPALPARPGPPVAPAAFMAQLRARLMRHDFVIEEGGQLGHTALQLAARRGPRRWERRPALQLYVVAAEDLEGYPGIGAIPAPPLVLLAWAARARHADESSALDRFWLPPPTVVAVVVSRHGLAPHAAARVEDALRAAEAPVLAAAVLVLEDEGVELLAPAMAWGAADATVRADLTSLLAGYRHIGDISR